MKKFNWKLLLVVALALVLVISLFACDPKTDDNNNNEPEPEPEVQTTDVDDFFDELYAVGGGIGQEEIATGKNVYLEAELGLALGTRVRGKEAANPVELGIALKALLDREHEDGKDSAFALDLTVGNAQAISLYYKLSDENVYLALGGQKVKINTKLIGLDKILGGLLNGKIGGDNGKTLPEYVSELAAKTGEDFTFDTFGAFLLQTFGLQSMIDGNATISGVLAPYKDGGVLSLQRLLEADLVRGAFTATKADLGTATRYTASLGHAGEIDGALLNTGMINGMIGGGAGVGDLDVKVSFDADSNHRLQDGVKVSLDLIVDQANELYASLPGAGSSKEYPFVQINIKHLNLQDGTGENLLPKDMFSYKENLQFQLEEHVAINGIKLAGQEVDEITIGLYADLDLVNEEKNNTKLRLFANVKTNTEYMNPETWNQDKCPIDVTYMNGRLTVATDATASVVQAMSQGLYPYDMLLAKPVGNLVDSLLPAAERDKFDALYWSEKPVKDEKGTITKDGTWNQNFHGIVIDHITVNDVLGLVLPKQQEQASATSSEEEAKGNIYNTIVYAFTLIGNAQNGQLTGDLAGTVANFAKYAAGANWTIQSMADTVKQFAEGAGLGAALGVLDFNGNEKGKDSIEFLFSNVKLGVHFDFTDGINWELDIIRHEEKRNDEGKLTTPGTHIKWTSSIRFDEEKITFADPSKAYDDAKKAYDKDYAAKKTDFEAKETKYNHDVTEYNAAEKERNDTQLYKNYLTASDAVKTVEATFNDDYFNYMTSQPGIGVYNVNTSSKSFPTPPTNSLGYFMDKYKTNYINWGKTGKDSYKTTAEGFAKSFEDALPKIKAAINDIANLKKAYQDAQDAYIAGGSRDAAAKNAAKKAITDVLAQYNASYFGGDVQEAQVFYNWFAKYDAYSKAGKPAEGATKTAFDTAEKLLNDAIAKYDETKIKDTWTKVKALIDNYANKLKAQYDANKAVNESTEGQRFTAAKKALEGDDSTKTAGSKKEYEEAKEAKEKLENDYCWYYLDFASLTSEED